MILKILNILTQAEYIIFLHILCSLLFSKRLKIS